MNEIIDFLKTRRSTTAKKMLEGFVKEEDLTQIISCGTRVPDHGALNPWKIVIIKDKTRIKLGLDVLKPEFEKNNLEASEEEINYERDRFLRANVVIAVISSPVSHPKISKWEMYLSAGAVCQNLLIAAQSLNYAAQWITEWYSYNEKMLTALGGNPLNDKIAGFIYIGQKENEPSERRRPMINKVVSFI